MNPRRLYADAKDNATEKTCPVYGESNLSGPTSHVGSMKPKNQHTAVQRTAEAMTATSHRPTFLSIMNFSLAECVVVPCETPGN